MPKKAALITVHGMGETKEDYNQTLVDKLRKKLGDSFNQLYIESIYYQKNIAG